MAKFFHCLLEIIFPMVFSMWHNSFEVLFTCHRLPAEVIRQWFLSPKRFPSQYLDLHQGNFGFAPSGSLNSILEFTRETEPIRVCVCVYLFIFQDLSIIYLSIIYVSIYLSTYAPIRRFRGIGSQSCGNLQIQNPQSRPAGGYSGRTCCRLQVGCLFLGETSVFVHKAFNWLDEACPHY